MISNDNLARKDFIPVEYRLLFNEIPKVEHDNFFEYLLNSKSKTHNYIKIANAIEKSIVEIIAPSMNWYFLFSKISFIGANYDNLIGFWEKPANRNLYPVYPFVARVYCYRNEFDLAIELCDQALVTIQEREQFNLLDISVFFEANFTLGLAYTYSRDFNKLLNVIKTIENGYERLIKDKNIFKDNYQDFIFFHSILQVLYCFFNGKTKEMREKLLTIKPWIEEIKDPWVKGYFFNLYGISHLQNHKINDGEANFKLAYKYFEKVHDLRGFTTVGANLGVSLLTRGYRSEGRKYLESILDPMVNLKNYSLAIANMLQVAKSYLDEKLIDTARKFLEQAEKLAVKSKITEPATCSLFCYFYSRLGEIKKADYYLEQLRVMAQIPQDMLILPRFSRQSEEDIYTLLWYYNAAGINAMAKGNLQLAQRTIIEGIYKADKNGLYDTSLELSTIAIEIMLKRYLIERKAIYLNAAIDLLQDIGTLILNIDNPYYITIFYILTSYLHLALSNSSEAESYFELAIEIAENFKDSEQYNEIILYNERSDFLLRASPSQTEQNPLLEPFFKYFLSDDSLPIFFTLKAIRLLNNLQFQQTNLLTEKMKEKFPLMLLILRQGGVTIFAHRFKKQSIKLDEVLVGGFLGALTSFSQELFGGMLNRVDQENCVLLIERISPTNILILIVDEETYHIRKKFKEFSQELTRMKVVEYISSDIYLTTKDPQYQVIMGLIEIIFGIGE